jgi:glycosyltransferase involved in cell wall biosynthesis
MFEACMKKVLFIATHRKDRAPGQRFRFEQYFDYLEANGFQCDLSYLISEKDDPIFYSKGNYPQKAAIYQKCRRIRRKDVRNAKNYDIIFIFREALMTGSIRYEQRMRDQSNAKFVFDFDDAIWLQNISDNNKKLAFLKNAQKTGEIIALCDMVFAGNQYLADYASRFCQDIKIVPTTIDTKEYEAIKVEDTGSICIGWTGSITTIQHFEYAVPVLKRIKTKYGDRVTIKVVGDGNYCHKELGIKGIAWSKKDEIKELSTMDIGIMPLPDDEWAKGKCGLKGLQYMSLGIPTIMSPVGVNSAIIADGENGFLAANEEEWEAKLGLMIEDAELRAKLGTAARRTVVDHYSVEANKDKYLAHFRALTS